MPINIGNVLKAYDEGKWVKIRNKAGEFSLKMKQFLPGEQFAFRKKLKEAGDELADVNGEIQKFVAMHICGWKDLLAADGQEIPFDQKLLEDDKFIGALMGFTAEDGGFLLPWLIRLISKSDFFSEDKETDFLAHI